MPGHELLDLDNVPIQSPSVRQVHGNGNPVGPAHPDLIRLEFSQIGV